MKSANKPEGAGAESMERRPLTQGNVLETCTGRTQRRVSVSPGLEQVRERAKCPIGDQGRWLGQVVRGYFAYHAVPTHGASLSAFLFYVKRLWLRTLRRRSQRDRLSWTRIEALLQEFLPPPRILHPWPDARFLVKHPRWEPGA